MKVWMPSALAAIVIMVGSASFAASIDEDLTQASNRFNSVDSRSFYAEHRLDRAPDGSVLPFGRCDPGIKKAGCEHNRGLLALNLPFAYRGNYEAQRTIASCLISGCDGALDVNLMLGCAWRIVIVASESPKLISADYTNVRTCGTNLDDRSKRSIRLIAEDLFRTIYKKDPPTAAR